MKVQVHLLGELSRFSNGQVQLRMNLNYDATVSYVSRRLKIPNSEIFSIFINSRLVTKKNVLLNEGDKIVFLPVVGGG